MRREDTTCVDVVLSTCLFMTYSKNLLIFHPHAKFKSISIMYTSKPPKKPPHSPLAHPSYSSAFARRTA